MTRATPFYRALIEPRLTMGMDRSLLGLLVIASMGLMTATKALWPLALGCCVGLVLRSVFASDPLYMAAYGNYCREGDEYDPWPTRSSVQSGRRAGHGRGVLC
jgi:type IV secretory pathway TrbD component